MVNFICASGAKKLCNGLVHGDDVIFHATCNAILHLRDVN